ncbi:MAG: XRE family transcriptional regulator [Mesorhizobium sp.]|uniref:LexA family transcriptional regulator n=1 Tax=unclassified Mesorhizobium TaxID=325217 RepID=UPI000FCCB3CE|nr:MULTISPECIES: S24 family peptidase [unclassified Mesorhizobium]RUW04027.1 XRE family transcriptional regulator [Mesorhizobium sp. M1A.F.Ca.IN.020.04.1.1]RUW04090.1 XRE family transcriptional regulator [Mesorhizobium sp. M1A.F.Ca.IN.020.04.1.1]TIN82775.1 MAG: XRE family transcriptional regulator [Mesorhizobium sp.]TIN88366.1 MAG: XRE family transcriptional regulator [Mesorhizobium sp.]TIO73367.1 MAG: XRE family transcriptional regulator [Mesorhizobium sp.]
MTNGLMRPMDNSPESIANRMRKLRERTGMSIDQMAREMGYASASSIQRYFDPGKLKTGYLKRDFVAKVEKVLLGKGNPPITRPEIWELAGPEFNFGALEPSNAVVISRDVTSGNKIPVYGSAVGGIDGEFAMNGVALYEVVAPPVLDNVSGAYAVQVSGESMEPRYFDGEVVYVNPHKRVVKGDFVIVQILANNEDDPPLAFVKRFVRHNAVELVLEQYNPPKQLKFPHERVKSVHFITMGGANS